MQDNLKLKLKNYTNTERIDENDPGNKKTSYYKRTNDGKQILRDMMSKYIPADVIEAKKQGFSSPDASWFKGESMDFVRKVIFGESNKTYEFFDRESILSLVDEHLTGKQNRRLLIWSLLNFEEFLNQFNLQHPST